MNLTHDRRGVNPAGCRNAVREPLERVLTRGMPDLVEEPVQGAVLAHDRDIDAAQGESAANASPEARSRSLSAVMMSVGASPLMSCPPGKA